MEQQREGYSLTSDKIPDYHEISTVCQIKFWPANLFNINSKLPLTENILKSTDESDNSGSDYADSGVGSKRVDDKTQTQVTWVTYQVRRA
mgnify:CR=1 FL=1